MRIKDSYQIGWNEFMEPFKEGFNLWFDLFSHLRITNFLDIAKFLILCYPYIPTIRNQISLLYFTKIIELVTPEEFSDSFSGILYNPLKTFVIFIVLVLHIVVGDWLSQYVLIKRPGEESIKHITVIKSLTHYSANKFKEF